MMSDPNTDKVSFSGQLSHNDGNIEVSIAADAMSATANLYPPLGEGAPLSADYAAELIARLGISHGLLWEELTEAIFKVNTESKPIRDLLIARGSPPQAELPEHIEPLKELLAGQTIDQAAHHIDWKTISSILLVKAGQPLARVVGQQPGQAGFTVTGMELPPAKASVQQFQLGQNVSRQEALVVADSDGKLNLEHNRISIEEVLHIKGDVDFHVGHISFPGDVVIDGSIGAGFRVYSGGSIVVKETMDAFDVQAKQDLLCGQGIIGKDLGQIRVGGRLEAKFIENARLAVRKDISVSGAIVGCRVYTLGKLLLGDKGRIVGGEISARDGLVCGWLGGKTHPQTLVQVGVDFTLQQKLDQANQALQDLSMKYQRLVQAAEKRPEPAILRLRDDMETKLKALAKSIGELNTRVDSNEDAVIEVHGGLYPGVSLSICHVRISIEQPMKKARFRLNRPAGRIVIET